MRCGTGTYRLDAASAEFFRARRFRLIHREGTIFGRYGRHGNVRGEISGHRMRAKWVEAGRSGWMSLEFDPRFAGFEGEYGLDGAPAAPSGQCAGQRVGSGIAVADG